MSKKYDYRKIKSKRPLKIKDICRIFKAKKLHEKSVRTWIRSGELEAFKIDGLIYVNGFILKEFLKNRSISSKVKLSLDEFKCWHCKYIGKPLDNVISRLAYGRNKSLEAHGKCPKCLKGMQRLFKRTELSEIQQIYSIQQNEVIGLYDSSCSTKSTHIVGGQKTPPNEPKKHKPPHSKSATKTSSKKAHINEQQLTLF